METRVSLDFTNRFLGRNAPQKSVQKDMRIVMACVAAAGGDMPILYAARLQQVRFQACKIKCSTTANSTCVHDL